MKKNRIYSAFDKAILRTPLLPFNKFMDEFTFNSETFDEALYLASADFYHLQKDLATDKINKTIYKYRTRACTRCTPFGLFATCSVVNIEDKTAIRLSPIENIAKHVRLDIRCIYQIINYLENKSSIRIKLKYYPNESLYRICDNLRYYEFSNRENKKITSKIVSILETDYLNRILKYSIEGRNIDDIVGILISDEISSEEALEYVNSLIDNQVLVSNLAPSENGYDWFYNIMKYLKEIDEEDKYISEICCALSSISKNDDNIQYYRQIINTLKDINIHVENDSVFHVDAFRPCESSTLSSAIVDDLLSGIQFLCDFTDKNNNYSLNRFRTKFYERYESQEMPLLYVLDSELGIDYINQNDIIELNEIFDGLKFPAAKLDETIKITPLKQKMLKKYVEAIKNNSKEIYFDELDMTIVSELEPRDFPSTMAVLCTIFQDKYLQTKILIKSVGSSTGSAVLTRFYNLHTSISDLIKAIYQKEKKDYTDSVIAEIAYLPNDKAGNILVKPSFRDYEITIFAKGGLDESCKIPASDLTIQLVNDEFVLKSKILNKKIIPSLSSAYNYQNSEIPIIRFLCDLQFQDTITPSIFDWGNEYSDLDYFPQVNFKNCIIMRQKWRIRRDELLSFNIKNEQETHERVQFWRTKRNMPSKVIFSEFDNELLIDFDIYISIKILMDIIIKKGDIIVEEFLYQDDTSIISCDSDYYSNEFVLTLYKK